MSINSEIRRITKKWGGKTTGSGIKDAICDLADNLPFGKETVETVIVPEQTVTAEDIMGTQGITIPNTSHITGIEGQEYTVIFNGVEYKAVAISQDGMVVLPLPITNPDTNENIGIAFQLSGGDMVCLTGELGDYTIAISTMVEKVTVIPTEFLPAGVGGGGDSPIIIDVTMDETDMALSTDALYNDVLGGYLNGVNQFIRVKDALGYPMQGFSLLQAISLVGSTQDIIQFGGFAFVEGRLLYVTIYVQEGALDDNGRAYVYMDPPMAITTTPAS